MLNSALLRRRSAISCAALLCASLFVSIAMVEIGLRCFGYGPFVIYRPAGNANINDEISLFLSDEVLGWRNRPGFHSVRPYSPDGHDISYTFLSAGDRITKAEHQENTSTNDTLILVGDSYTEGWAVSDDETYAWKLQDRLPDMRVVNFGTGG